MELVRVIRFSPDGDEIRYYADIAPSQLNDFQKTFSDRAVDWACTHGPLCNGFINWVRITPTRLVIRCRNCGMHVRIPASIKTVGDLEKYVCDLVKTYNPPIPTMPKDEKTTLPVGVSVLITNKDGKVLMAKRKNNTGAGMLSTPGGRLEQHETIPECAVREAFEEATESPIVVADVIGWREHFRFGKHYIMFYVWSVYDGVIVNKEPDKTEDWEWFHIADVQTCAHANSDFTTEPMDILLELGRRVSGGLSWKKEADRLQKEIAGLRAELLARPRS